MKMSVNVLHNFLSNVWNLIITSSSLKDAEPEISSSAALTQQTFHFYSYLYSKCFFFPSIIQDFIHKKHAGNVSFCGSFSDLWGDKRKISKVPSAEHLT